MNGIGAIVSEQLTKVYPLANMFQKAIVNADMVAFILFVGISVIWYYLFVKILSLKYKQINTGITTYHMLSNYEINSMKKRVYWSHCIKRAETFLLFYSVCHK